MNMMKGQVHSMIKKEMAIADKRPSKCTKAQNMDAEKCEELVVFITRGSQCVTNAAVYFFTGVTWTIIVNLCHSMSCCTWCYAVET